MSPSAPMDAVLTEYPGATASPTACGAGFFILNDQDMRASTMMPLILPSPHNPTQGATSSGSSFAGVLRTVILPPKPSMMRDDIASPRPVPFPGCLVVKKGSKIFFKLASGIPQPLSITSGRGSPLAIGCRFSAHSDADFSIIGRCVTGVEKRLINTCPAMRIRLDLWQRTIKTGGKRLRF